MDVRNRIETIIGKSGSFRQNALLMSSGAVMNVLISIGLYPIVTRLFSKEDFGNVGLYLAVVSLIALVGTSFYPSGFVIPKFRRDFYAMLKLSLILLISTVLFVVSFIFLFEDLFVFIFQINSIRNLMWLIPPGILLVGVKTISVNWNIRNKDFRLNAVSAVVSSGSDKLLNIGFALTLGASAFGLIFSSFLSIIFAIITLGISKMIRGGRILRRISIEETFAIGKKYKKFPLHLLPGNLINKYTSDLPIYLLTAYFSPSITGAFVLANNIMNIPLNIIGNSFSSVFLQRANELYLESPKKMSLFAKRINQKMLFVGVLAFGILFGFGDLIFSVAFGKEWLLSGEFAAILSIYYIFKLVSAPMAKVFMIVGKEQFSLYVSIILAIARSIGIFFGVISGEPITAIKYFTFANFIGYLITYMFIYKACSLPIFRSVFETLTIVSLVFLFIFFIRYRLSLIFSWFEFAQ